MESQYDHAVDTKTLGKNHQVIFLALKEKLYK